MSSKLYRSGLLITFVLAVGRAQPEQEEPHLTSLSGEIHKHVHPFKLLFKHESMPEDPILPILLRNYFWPWSHMSPLYALSQAEDNVEAPKIFSDDKKFQVNLNVKNFKPVSLKVKVSNGYVIVHGKSDDGDNKDKFIASHFVQRYALPQGSKAEEVTAEMSSDGILTITVPRHKEVLQHKGIEVPIKQTNELFETSETKTPSTAETQVTENIEKLEINPTIENKERKDSIKPENPNVSDDKKVKKKELKSVKGEKVDSPIVLDNNTLDHTTARAA